MKGLVSALVVSFLCLPVLSQAQGGRSGAVIQYVYPAGCQQGQSVTVTVGGREFAEVQSAVVSGSGVTAELGVIQTNWLDIYEDYMPILSRMKSDPKYVPGELTYQPKDPDQLEIAKNRAAEDKELMTKIPDLPMFNRVEEYSIEDFRIYQNLFETRQNVQDKPQLNDQLSLKITVAADAPPGMREIRLVGQDRVSNPIRFFVSTVHEVYEREPNDRECTQPTVETLPFAFNGQCQEGDVDRIRFQAKKDQQLVIKGDVRALIPYLADAVPGWFQGVLSLRDENGRELTYNDDWRFDPDPVMFYKAPQDMILEVSIRDSIYRGREDFTYRVQVGETAFVTAAFPLGGQSGERTTMHLQGHNLPSDRILLDNHLPGPQIRMTNFDPKTRTSNQVRYAIDDLPEIFESKENNSKENAEPVTLPVIINGRMEISGDMDSFRFEGKKGEEIVVDVMARRLHSPMDSFIRLFDGAGKLLASNDDHTPSHNTGLLTHHCDSYLRQTLPADGSYVVQILDTFRQVGPPVGYRLRISEPRPAFTAYVTPGGFFLPFGKAVPMTVYIERTDGFAENIYISVDEEFTGFQVSGNPIPPGVDSFQMTVRSSTHEEKTVPLKFWARSRIGDKVIKQEAFPAEEVTQAFIIPHVLESVECMALLGKGSRDYPIMELTDQDPVRIKLGGSVSFEMLLPELKDEESIDLKLYKADQGLLLSRGSQSSDKVHYTVMTEKPLKAGDGGSILVEAFARKRKEEGRGFDTVSLGMLPAVSYTITEPDEPIEEITDDKKPQ